VHSQVQTTLTTSLNGMRYTYAPMVNGCPGDIMNLNCMVKGSRILTWSSDQFIGTDGRQLEFTDSDSEGRELRSDVDPNTVAVLTSMDSDTRTMISTLDVIVASFDVSNSSIVCDQRNTNRTAASVTLYYLGRDT
jgi:hypothetical protein